YRRLATRGPRADRLVAYTREEIVVVAPRLVYPLLRLDERGVPSLRFTEEHVLLPKRCAPRYLNVLTDTPVTVDKTHEAPRVWTSDLFADLPVAVLVPQTAGDERR
ncbi:MAG TPA: hypothetical protein VNG31_01040, partial [Candidatus Baltobacteraceae bacterium]|nr:hypothetical protein [Candidatus Baltobacteraceae bacterium]